MRLLPKISNFIPSARNPSNVVSLSSEDGLLKKAVVDLDSKDDEWKNWWPLVDGRLAARANQVEGANSTSLKSRLASFDVTESARIHSYFSSKQVQKCYCCDYC